MPDTKQIKELLGTGLSNEIVASAVGCEPSYISQLMANGDFAAEVVGMRTTALTANTRRDRSLDVIEDALIVQLGDLVEENRFYKPNDVLRALATVNNAKRRGVPAHQSLVLNNTVVNLSLPTQVVVAFKTTASGEVVEVEGQTLVTKPAHVLLQELSQKHKDENDDLLNEAADTAGSSSGRKPEDRYATAARYLPTAGAYELTKGRNVR